MNLHDTSSFTKTTRWSSFINCPAFFSSNVKGQPATWGPYDPDRRIFQTPAGPLWLIHRLDQETSGILLAAKTPESAKIFRTSFEKKEVEKDYVVLVARKPLPPQGRWSDFLAEKKRAGGIKVFVTKGPKPNALLHYITKDFYPGQTSR